MKVQRWDSRGYTIIETIIVLTVSVTIFVSIATALSQQNRRTQFTSSVTEFQIKLQDVLNDVETGFFPAANNIQCSVGEGNAPVPHDADQEQGTNQECTFVGKTIVFSGETYTIYTLAGARENAGKEITNINDANPREVNFLTDSGTFSAGVGVTDVIAREDNSSTDAISILSSFGQSAGGTLQSGLGTRTVLATSPALPYSASSELSTNNIIQARKGLIICLEETGGGRKATVEIGTVNAADPIVTIDSKEPLCGFDT